MAFNISLKKHSEEEIIRRNVEEICPSPEIGLTASQAAERKDNGYGNIPLEPPTKTVGEIIRTNLLTYFNIVFFALAACIIAVGSWNDLTFMPVVIANIFIGIIQELRSKRTLDKLSIINSPKGVVVRDSAYKTVNIEDTVRDDIVVFAQGNQIFADAIVVSGECLVNEALMTGEADEIKKGVGDELMSGSFVVSGSVRARLTRVGKDSYVSRLTLESKKSNKVKQSEMMRSLSSLVKWIGIALIPIGAAMAVKEIVWLDRTVKEGVSSTVGALVGMIPEGLYLLTSIALVAAVVRLAQRKTLVHDMNCIETLARVDTLCVDKTGTITENKMIVEDVCLLCEDRFIADDIRMIMSDYVFAMQDDNDTMAALRKYFSGEHKQTAIETLPFTSVKKYGGVSFHEDETYILGAPDIILGDNYEKYREKIDFYSKKGCRVLLLALYDGKLSDEALTSEIMPLALVLLANKIRKNAPETFEYFEKQGVTIKVISGDNALTVSEVAKRAGIANAEKYVDARTLGDDKKIRKAAEEYTVFGRVTPEQKRKLIKAMKAEGHTVAMTGDGVNDVLALKEADCSVAMASGSDVACQVSHVVLLNSNFASMPSVVMEGRRVINNIERSASLFLVKNIFSFVMALISLIFTLPYPLTPAQISLVSTLSIGIPSFVLAMEPNESLVRGKFMRNVIFRALPGGLTDVILIVGVMLFYIAFDFPTQEMSTICAIIMGVVGMLVLHRICIPYNRIRKLLMISMSATFVFMLIFFRELFTLTELTFSSKLVLMVFVFLAYPLMKTLSYGLEGLKSSFEESRSRTKKRAGRHVAAARKR
ncbi:MAG: cation-translocating P-type ATPase [Clostridiales bacterium]|jgi:cation-transporting ATPase E|nr:cation-translocating P-type ATPase [Clostridiales bacterium]